MRALVAANGRSEEVRAVLGLGRGSGRLKALLALSQQSPLSVGQIADSLSVDAAYATLIVNHLEALGYVTRDADPSDRRRKLISLTPTGASATAEAEAVHNRPPAELDRLSTRELTQLRHLLERLSA